MDSGLLQQFKQQYFPKPRPQAKSHNSTVLQLKYLQGPLYILLSGISLACISFSIEVILERFDKKQRLIT